MSSKKYPSHKKNKRKRKERGEHDRIDKLKEANSEILSEDFSVFCSSENIYKIEQSKAKKPNKKTHVQEVNSWIAGATEKNPIKENKNGIENTWKTKSRNKNVRFRKNKNEYKIYIKLDNLFYKKSFIRNSANTINDYSSICEYCHQIKVNDMNIRKQSIERKNDEIEKLKGKTIYLKKRNNNGICEIESNISESESMIEIRNSKLVSNEKNNNELTNNHFYDTEPKIKKIKNENLIKNVNKILKRNINVKNNNDLIEDGDYYGIKVTSNDKKMGKKIYESLFLKNSKIHGIGLFTNVDINKDTYLMKYEGEVIGKCMSDKRERMYIKNGIDSIYMFEVDTDMIIDATKLGNMARYINHSCNPNCVSITNTSEKSIMYFTKRNIQKGNELTIDYNSNEVIENETCNCGDEKCKDIKNDLNRQEF